MTSHDFVNSGSGNRCMLVPFFFLLLLGSLSAMRFVAAVQEKEKDGEKVVNVSRELWRRIWSEDKDITEPASLSEVQTL